MEKLWKRTRAEIRGISEKYPFHPQAAGEHILQAVSSLSQHAFELIENLPELLGRIQKDSARIYRREVLPVYKALAKRVTVKERRNLNILVAVTLGVQLTMLGIGALIAQSFRPPYDMPELPAILPDLVVLSAPGAMMKYGFLKVNNGLLVGYGSSGRGLYAIVRFLDDLFFPPLYTASFVSLNAKLHQFLPKRKRQLTNDVPLTIASMDYIENAILTVLMMLFTEGNINGGLLGKVLASIVPLVQTIKFGAMFLTIFGLAAQYVTYLTSAKRT